MTPPQGRYHESLWEIAQRHLGDGRRYNEIFELNKDVTQPDGSRLTSASLIRPGWVLKMPGDAAGQGIQTVGQQRGQQAPRSRPAQQTARQGQEDTLSLTQRGGNGGAATGVASRPGTGTGTTADGETAAGLARSVAANWPYELSAASLLAAGVLAALGRRRRERLWQRGFGRRLVAPVGDAAVAEAALRLGADDPAVQLLDTSLRQLSAALAAQGKTPPTVFAAHLGGEQVDLWIAPADPAPPAPWQAVSDGQVWRLPVAAAASLDVARLDGDRALAPYPGLVTLGTNDSGRVMVDLEAAHGLIAVRGPSVAVSSALAALAVELVTNRWSDRMRVTLVGFGSGLELIAPDRVELVGSLEEALPALEKRAADLEGQLSEWGMDSVLTGRSVTSNPDAWAPHYLIMGVPPTPEQAERLQAVARTRHRAGLGLVVAGEVPGASWDWELTAEGRLRAGVLGLDLAAQLLPPAQYAAVVSLFRDGDDAPLTLPAPGQVPAAHLRPGAPVAVEVGLLGPAVVGAPGAIEPDRAALATELVMYLAAHPGGVHPNVLAGALWPRGVPNEVRDATLARVRQWLGMDHRGAGEPGHRPRRTAAARSRRGGRLAGVPRAHRPGGRGARRSVVRHLAAAGAEPHPRAVARRAGSKPVRVAAGLRLLLRGHGARRGHRAEPVRVAAGPGGCHRCHGGRASGAAAGVRRRDALAGPAARRGRHRAGTGAARSGRRGVGPGGTR